MKRIANTGNMIIKIITGLLTVIFLLYSILMIWDKCRTELEAFSSYDLLQYRPNIEEFEPPYLDDLIKINPDTVGWVTIYDTNIDYPIVQGSDDMEYVNKNVYGEYSASGSIFLAARNKKDFSEPYSLVYGHHMANGSMFGHILNFKDKAFFDKVQKGVLILPDEVYDLQVMAVVSTSAYDRNIYWVNKESTDEVLQYIKPNALYYREAEYERLLALSTCDDASTMGRTVLICAMTHRTAPLPAREDGNAVPRRKAVGHPMAGAYWSLMNLITLLTTLYFSIKIAWKKRKNKLLCFTVAGLGLMSLLIFFITEDLSKPIQLVDVWTIIMILIPALIWLITRRFEKNEE